MRKRGRAIALAGVGSNMGNVIMTPVTVWILAVYNWQTSFVLFAVVTWLAVLLPSILLMRRQPEDMGLHPDGAEPEPMPVEEAASGDDPRETAATSAPLRREAVWGRRDVIRVPAFWLLIASISVANLAFQGIRPFNPDA